MCHHFAIVHLRTEDFSEIPTANTMLDTRSGLSSIDNRYTLDYHYTPLIKPVFNLVLLVPHPTDLPKPCFFTCVGLAVLYSCGCPTLCHTWTKRRPLVVRQATLFHLTCDLYTVYSCLSSRRPCTHGCYSNCYCYWIANVSFPSLYEVYLDHYRLQAGTYHHPQAGTYHHPGHSGVSSFCNTWIIVHLHTVCQNLKKLFHLIRISLESTSMLQH